MPGDDHAFVGALLAALVKRCTR